MKQRVKITAVAVMLAQEGAKVAGTYEASMNNVGKQMGSFKRLVDEALGS